MPLRISLGANGIATEDEVVANFVASEKYNRVSWDHFYRPCAVVGGGMSVQSRLNILRTWPGDVFGINDTVEYLSNNNIPSFLYAIDVSPIPYRKGSLCRGALLASRANHIQFTDMKDKPIWVFDLVEENPTDGIEGGPTAVCRTPHLLLKMGYRKVHYFGIDGSFNDANSTHVSGFSRAAYENMIIINAGGKDYYTNAAFMLQSECMLKYITDYKDFLILESDGLIKAMMDDPEWSCVAVADDLKAKYAANGFMGWNVPYVGGNEEWQQQATS